MRLISISSLLVLGSWLSFPCHSPFYLNWETQLWTSILKSCFCSHAHSLRDGSSAGFAALATRSTHTSSRSLAATSHNFAARPADGSTLEPPLIKAPLAASLSTKTISLLLWSCRPHKSMASHAGMSSAWCIPLSRPAVLRHSSTVLLGTCPPKALLPSPLSVLARFVGGLPSKRSFVVVLSGSTSIPPTPTTLFFPSPSSAHR